MLIDYLDGIPKRLWELCKSVVLVFSNSHKSIPTPVLGAMFIWYAFILFLLNYMRLLLNLDILRSIIINLNILSISFIVQYLNNLVYGSVVPWFCLHYRPRYIALLYCVFSDPLVVDHNTRTNAGNVLCAIYLVVKITGKGIRTLSDSVYLSSSHASL
jgi:hypothetical protein